MMKSEADWNLYRTFLAVVRAGSFSGAARLLSSTQPTVTRQVEALEGALGTKLFTRSQRGQLPTTAARDLIEPAESMEVAAEALRRASIPSASQGGAVRLATGAQIGIELLPALLADFSRTHPNIQVELSISSRLEDLLQREADIAIRMSRPTQKALIARLLGQVKIGLFAHRRYLDAFGTPTSVGDLAGHRLIGFDRDSQILKSFGELATRLRREDFAFRTDNVSAQLALLRAGVGIGACHANLARAHGDLVRILPKHIAFQREVWLVMHADLRKTRRVRFLFDHLQRTLAPAFTS